jgi:hypothetical protein
MIETFCGLTGGIFGSIDTFDLVHSIFRKCLYGEIVLVRFDIALRLGWSSQPS